MLNSNSHQIGDMAHMHREELIRDADEQRLKRLVLPRSNTPWATVRTAVGDWLISAGQQLKPESRPMIGREAHQN